jgi:hypothetical protein
MGLFFNHAKMGRPERIPVIRSSDELKGGGFEGIDAGFERFRPSTTRTRPGKQKMIHDKQARIGLNGASVSQAFRYSYVSNFAPDRFAIEVRELVEEIRALDLFHAFFSLYPMDEEMAPVKQIACHDVEDLKDELVANNLLGLRDRVSQVQSKVALDDSVRMQLFKNKAGPNEYLKEAERLLSVCDISPNSSYVSDWMKSCSTRDDREKSYLKAKELGGKIDMRVFTLWSKALENMDEARFMKRCFDEDLGEMKCGYLVNTYGYSASYVERVNLFNLVCVLIEEGLSKEDQLGVLNVWRNHANSAEEIAQVHELSGQVRRKTNRQQPLG